MFKIITLLSLFLFVAACNNAPKNDAEPESPNHNNQNPPPDPLNVAKADAKTKADAADTKIARIEPNLGPMVPQSLKDAKKVILRIRKLIADPAATKPKIEKNFPKLQSALDELDKDFAVVNAEDKIREADTVIGIANPLAATNPTLTPLINVLTTARGELDAAAKAKNIATINTEITNVETALNKLKANPTYSGGARTAALDLYNNALNGKTIDKADLNDLQKALDALEALTVAQKAENGGEVTTAIDDIKIEQARRIEEARLAKEKAEKLAEAVKKAENKIVELELKLKDAENALKTSKFTTDPDKNDPTALKAAKKALKLDKEELANAKTVEAINKAIEKVDAELSNLKTAKEAFDTKEQELAEAQKVAAANGDKLAEAKISVNNEIKKTEEPLKEANKALTDAKTAADKTALINAIRDVADAVTALETARDAAAATADKLTKAITDAGIDAKIAALDGAKKAFEKEEARLVEEARLAKEKADRLAKELADAISTAKNEIEIAKTAITEAENAIKDAKITTDTVTDAIDEVNKVIAALNGLIAGDKETKENIDNSVTNLKGAVGELKEAQKAFVKAEGVEAARLADEKRIADKKAKKLADALELYNQALNGGTIDKADLDALVNAYNALDALTDKTGSRVAFNAISTELVQRVTNKIADAKKLHDDLKHDLPYKKTFADAIKKAEKDINSITDAQGIKTLLEEIQNAMSNFSSADKMQAEAGYPVDPADAKKDIDKKIPALEALDLSKKNSYKNLSEALKEEIKKTYDLTLNTVKTSESVANAADYIKEFDDNYYKPVSEFIDLLNNFTGFVNLTKEEDAGKDALDAAKQALEDNGLNKPQKIEDVSTHIDALKQAQTDLETAMDDIENAKKDAALSGMDRINDDANIAANEAVAEANDAILNNKLGNSANVDDVKEAMKETSEAQKAFLTTGTQDDKNTLVEKTTALANITKEFIEKERIAQEKKTALDEANKKRLAKITEIGTLIKQAEDVAKRFTPVDGLEPNKPLPIELDIINPAIAALQQDQNNIAKNLKTVESIDTMLTSLDLQNNITALTNAITQVKELAELKDTTIQEKVDTSENAANKRIKKAEEVIAGNPGINPDALNAAITAVEKEITILESEGDDESGNNPANIAEQIKNIKDSMTRLDTKLGELDTAIADFEKLIAAASAPAVDPAKELEDTIKLAEAKIVEATNIYNMSAAKLRDDAKLVATVNKNLVTNKKSEIKGAMDSLREKITEKNLAEINTALEELTRIITPAK